MKRLLVGDDVVDLARPRTTGKADDSRFLRRILTEAEIATVRTSAAPERALWTFWACKEAAYKIHSKAAGTPPVFAHRSYQVELLDGGGGDAPLDGSDMVRARIRWTSGAADAEVRRSARVVHAVARMAGPSGSPEARVEAGSGLLDDAEAHWAGSLEALLDRLSAVEADAVHSRASAAVRIAARETLARLLEVEESRVAILCAPGPTGRRPPSVLLDGSPSAADVSLTHDGAWIAWVASVPAEP